MGKPKYVYFTDENHERLKKEPNASRLINELLDKHYNSLDLERMTSDELRKYKARKLLEKKYQEEMEKIENGD